MLTIAYKFKNIVGTFFGSKSMNFKNIKAQQKFWYSYKSVDVACSH